MLDYYTVNKQASLKIDNHPGLLRLKDLCRSSAKILDVGCGEGSRLATLLPKNKIGWGIDISQQAIKLANYQYPKFHFQVADAQKLPFKENTFDLVYSAFAIEHCSDPRLFIDEMLRVCKSGGHIVILCPNYGAPNRRSPVSSENPVSKLVMGFIKDFFQNTNLMWKHVLPKAKFEYIDADTTVEPYAGTLYQYLSGKNVEIEICSSVWEIEPLTNNPRKWLTKTLGSQNIFPFKYWGPQIFSVSRKI